MAWPDARLDPTSAEWRGRAVELAQRHEWSRAARYVGRSARGTTYYRVASQRLPSLTYLVTEQRVSEPQGPQGGQGEPTSHWRCNCPQGTIQRPCTHAGAAILLGAYRGEVVEAKAAAQAAGMRWVMAQPGSGTAEGERFYSVARSQERLWDMVRVLWDARPGREVARWCECEQIGCTHIGAVALRRAHDAEVMERERRTAHFDEVTKWWMRATTEQGVTMGMMAR